MVDESKDNLVCQTKIQKIEQMGLVKESVPKFRIPQHQMSNPRKIKLQTYLPIIGHGS